MTSNQTEARLLEDIYTDLIARLDTSHYYIKRASVVEKILFDNRSFYPKFEKIDEPFNDTLLKQHQNKELIVALCLLKDGYTNSLVIEYKGKEVKKFCYTIRQLFSHIDITEYSILEGKRESHIQVFIKTKTIALQEAEAKLLSISQMLSLKLPKEWQTLPSTSLPLQYNIVTLPYKLLY